MEDQGRGLDVSWSEVEARIDEHVRGLDDDELSEVIGVLEEERTVLDIRRWVLIDRIDMLRAERRRRAGAGIEELGADAWVARALARGRRTRPSSARGQLSLLAPLAPFPLLESLADDALFGLLRDEERMLADVSARRHLVWEWRRILEAEQGRRRPVGGEG